MHVQTVDRSVHSIVGGNFASQAIEIPLGTVVSPSGPRPKIKPAGAELLRPAAILEENLGCAYMRSAWNVAVDSGAGVPA
jgi:hypothetical protein